MLFLLLQTKNFKVEKVEGSIAYVISTELIGMTMGQADAFLRRYGYKPAIAAPEDTNPAMILVENESGEATPSHLYYHTPHQS